MECDFPENVARQYFSLIWTRFTLVQVRLERETPVLRFVPTANSHVADLMQSIAVTKQKLKQQLLCSKSNGVQPRTSCLEE